MTARSFVVVAFVCVLILPSCSVAAQTVANAPITKENLVSALEYGKAHKDARKPASWWVDRIQRYRVAFQIDAQNEQEIRHAGDYLRDKQLDDLIAAIRKNYHQLAAPTGSVVQPAKSRFSEKLTQVMVSLGEKGISFNFRLSDLEKPYPLNSPTSREPLGYVYTRDGVFYFDVDIFYSFDYPPIKVRQNQVTDRPPNWDRNFDDSGFEIVDEGQRPRLQFYYTSPSRILIKGIFLSGRHLWLVDALAQAYLVDAIPMMPEKMRPPQEFSIKRLFKYPSLRFQGQREE